MSVVCMCCTGCNVKCHNDNDDARRLHECGECIMMIVDDEVMLMTFHFDF